MPSLRSRSICAVALVACSPAWAYAVWQPSNLPRATNLPTSGISRGGASGQGTAAFANGKDNRAKQPFLLKTSLPSSSAAVASAEPSGDKEPKQSLSAGTFNLVKACVGSGVLALPAGVAAIGDVPIALVPAVAMVIVLGAVSGYSFHMIGRITHGIDQQSSTNSISKAWEQEIGKDSAWLSSLACLLSPLGALLTFLILLGDILSSLAQTAGVKGFPASRSASVLGVSLAVLYPLCNLKSLASLAPVSMAGVLGMIMTCGFMVVRSLAGGPYSSGGALVGSVTSKLQPSFGVVGTKMLSPSLLVLCSMIATGYLAHFSAHEFYDGLEDGNLKRFGVLTGVGFGLITAINLTIMAFGFLTFGGACNGNILNNYSNKDVGAVICRAVVAFSLIGGFPILFRAAKSSLFDLTQKGKKVSDKKSKQTTGLLLGAITAAALVLNDAGFVVGFTGALMGSSIIYIFPSLVYLKASSRRIKEGLMKKTKRVVFERAANKVMIAFGVFCALAGSSVTILKTFFPGVL